MSYLKGWLILDLMANVPCGLFKAIPQKPSADDIKNILHLNFAYIPRIYVIFLFFKLVRIRKAKPLYIKFLKKIGLGVDSLNLGVTLWTLLLILHILACFWGTSASFNLSSNQNWIFKAGIQDESVTSKYVTCLYWASYTVITVGYGDIIPQNSYETLLACAVFLLGVALFSYSLSTLANQFASLSISVSKRKNRENLIESMNKLYGIPDGLINKIKFYFSHSETVISISQDYEIHTILRILPPNLKTQLTLFLYQDAIIRIPFLQMRDQMFYLNYLDRLTPVKFSSDMILL